MERGRKRLHERLVRRGLALPAALVAVVASRGVVSAALAQKIVQGAVAFASGGRGVVSQQVIALAEGGLRARFWTKTKVVLVVLVASGLLGTGTSWLALGPGKGDASNNAKAVGAEAKPDKAEAAPAAEKKADKMKTLLEQRRDFAKDAFEAWLKGAVSYRESANEMRRRIGPGGTGDRNVIAALQAASMQASNTQDAVYRWAQRLLAAELDLSDKVSDRVATYERHSKRMKQLEKVFPEDAESKFHSLDAEVLLERAKAK